MKVKDWKMRVAFWMILAKNEDSLCIFNCCKHAEALT